MRMAIEVREERENRGDVMMREGIFGGFFSPFFSSC